MVCSNCGKEIKDGADYCLECGAPLDAPVVIKVTKEDIKAANKKKKQDKVEKPETAEGPFIDLGGYIKSLGKSMTNLLALVGAILVYLAPFMSWLWKKQSDISFSANMFDISRGNADFAVAKTKMAFFLAVVTMAVGLIMLLFSARDYFKPFRRFSVNYIVRLLPVVAGIVALVLTLNNKVYHGAYVGLHSSVERAGSLGAAYEFKGGRGLGLPFFIAGLVVYGVSVLLDISRKDKQE